MRSRQSYQAGFSLVEVLVTTVIFSIGILGVTGLNAFSKRAGFDAVQRSTAAEFAFALLEEMRYNSTAINVYLAAATIGRGSLGAAPLPSCDAVLAPCTPAQLAAESLWDLEQALDTGFETVGPVGTGGLVMPTACISGPALPGAGIYTVTVVWRGVTELSDPAINDCGAATGLYGDDNAFRRMVVIQTYIDPSI